MAQLMFPDIAGQVNQGLDRGRGMAFNRLAGLAVQNPDQAQQYLGQAAGINPAGALQVQHAMTQQQDAQQKAQQTQQQEAMKKLGGAARYMQAALQTRNPRQVQGAWDAVRPFLAQMSGKEPPAQWDPQMEPLLYQVIAQTASQFPDGGANGQPSAVQAFRYFAQGLTPEEQAEARKVQLGLAPRQSSAAIKYMQVLGPDGRTRLVAVDPREVGATVVGGQQSGVGAPGPVAGPAVQPPQTVPGANGQAVTFDFPPGTPQGVIDAAHAYAQANGDIAPGAAPTPFVSPTQAQSAFATESGKQAAQTAGEQARIPVDAAGEAAKVTAKGEAQRKLDAPLARSQLSGVTSGYDRMISSVDQILASPGLERAVGLGSYVPGIRGGSKQDAEALIKALKSQVGFNVLQNMRDMSKTGGALGQISDKEEELLQNNLAALSTDQSPAQFRQQLLKIKQFAADSKRRMQDAFNTQYGQAQGAPQAGGDDIDAIIRRNLGGAH